MSSNIMLTLLFLAAVLVVYYLAPQRARWGIVLLASIIFYLSAASGMALLLLSSWWAWYSGKRIEGVQTEKGKRGWLLCGILPLLGILFVFKYFNFFSSSVAAFLAFLGFSSDPLVLNLILPMGISYYTFKIISYVADIYRGKQRSEPHLGYYLTYVLFFPQIVSGPIERSEGFLEQLHEGPAYDSELFAQGIQRIVLGLFKKFVIANRLSGYVNTIYGAPGDYPGLAAALAAVFYSFQIYCDFSGYSDIAIGMGNLLGIRGGRNFNYPYFAENIREFWSRWHISLSSWLRDYIYIPLGGSRVTRIRKNMNVMAVFLASGLWHGDNWTFLVWGGIHGLWNMFCKKERKQKKGWLQRAGTTLLTFLGVTFAWIFFRAESLGAAIRFIRRMILGFSLSFADIQNSILPFTGDNTCAACFLTVCLFLLLLFVYEWQQVYGRGKRDGEESALSTPWLVVMMVSVFLFGVFGESGFLYAQF